MDPHASFLDALSFYLKALLGILIEGSYTRAYTVRSWSSLYLHVGEYLIFPPSCRPQTFFARLLCVNANLRATNRVLEHIDGKLDAFGKVLDFLAGILNHLFQSSVGGSNARLRRAGLYIPPDTQGSINSADPATITLLHARLQKCPFLALLGVSFSLLKTIAVNGNLAFLIIGFFHYSLSIAIPALRRSHLYRATGIWFKNTARRVLLAHGAVSERIYWLGVDLRHRFFGLEGDTENRDGGLHLLVHDAVERRLGGVLANFSWTIVVGTFLVVMSAANWLTGRTTVDG